jgi:hypothetical protein
MDDKISALIEEIYDLEDECYSAAGTAPHYFPGIVYRVFKTWVETAILMKYVEVDEYYYFAVDKLLKYSNKLCGMITNIPEGAYTSWNLLRDHLDYLYQLAVDECIEKNAPLSIEGKDITDAICEILPKRCPWSFDEITRSMNWINREDRSQEILAKLPDLEV